MSPGAMLRKPPYYFKFEFGIVRGVLGPRHYFKFEFEIFQIRIWNSKGGSYFKTPPYYFKFEFEIVRGVPRPPYYFKFDEIVRRGSKE